MKTLVAISLGLNLALLGALGWRQYQPPLAPVAALRPTRDAQAVTQSVQSAAPVAPATVVMQTNRLGFNWSLVADVDFKSYRDNLRAIGCPEKTLRDILTAEVDRAFAQRRRDLLAPLQARFWSLIAGGKGMDEFEKVLEPLNEERSEVLKELFTKESDPKETEAERRTSTKRRFDFVTEEKAQQLTDLEEKYRALRDEAGKQKHPGTPVEQGKARQKRQEELRQQLLAEQKKLLTPQEFDELRLRNGNLTRWAENIPGFDPTPEQQRAVALARLQLSDPVDPNAPDAKEQMKAREAERKKFEDEGLRDILGEAGYAAYKRGQDNDYQSMARVVSRLEQPPALADEAWQIRQSAMDAVRALNSIPTLPAGEKSASVLAIHAETVMTLQQKFGTDGYGAYREIGGQWLDRIAKLAAPTNGPPPPGR